MPPLLPSIPTHLLISFFARAGREISKGAEHDDNTAEHARRALGIATATAPVVAPYQEGDEQRVFEPKRRAAK